MKNFIKKWLIKNKILLITFGVTSVITFGITLFEINLILTNLEDLDYYANTGIISDGLRSVGLLGVFNIVLIGLWILLLLWIMWKVVFPSPGTVKTTFYASELNFLRDLPSNVRRELDKK